MAEEDAAERRATDPDGDASATNIQAALTNLRRTVFDNLDKIQQHLTLTQEAHARDAAAAAAAAAPSSSDISAAKARACQSLDDMTSRIPEVIRHALQQTNSGRASASGSAAPSSPPRGGAGDAEREDQERAEAERERQEKEAISDEDTWNHEVQELGWSSEDIQAFAWAAYYEAMFDEAMCRGSPSSSCSSAPTSPPSGGDDAEASTPPTSDIQMSCTANLPIEGVGWKPEPSNHHVFAAPRLEALDGVAPPADPAAGPTNDEAASSTGPPPLVALSANNEAASGPPPRARITMFPRERGPVNASRQL